MIRPLAAALAFALVLGSCGGVAPMDTPGRQDVAIVVIDESWLGFAVCKTRPTAWVRVDVFGTPEGPAAIAHELAHAEIMASFPSCTAYELWRALPGNRALLEAHGHCAAAMVDTITGRMRTWDAAIRMHAARLAYAYPFGLTELEAESLIRRFCHTAPERAP